MLHFVNLNSIASFSVYVPPLHLVPFGLKRKGHCEEKYDMIILLILVYRHTHSALVHREITDRVWCEKSQM